jgi:hypothetical protein
VAGLADCPLSLALVDGQADEGIADGLHGGELAVGFGLAEAACFYPGWIVSLAAFDLALDGGDLLGEIGEQEHHRNFDFFRLTVACASARTRSHASDSGPLTISGGRGSGNIREGEYAVC